MKKMMTIIGMFAVAGLFVACQGTDEPGSEQMALGDEGAAAVESAEQAAEAPANVEPWKGKGKKGMKGMKGHHHKGPGPQMLLHALRMHGEEIGLTAEQQAQLEDIVGEAKELREGKKGQRGEFRDDMHEMMSAAELDEAGLQQKHDEMTAERREVREAEFAVVLDALEVLSTEQRTELFDIIDARRAEMKEKFGKGPGPRGDGECDGEGPGPFAGKKMGMKDRIHAMMGMHGPGMKGPGMKGPKGDWDGQGPGPMHGMKGPGMKGRHGPHMLPLAVLAMSDEIGLDEDQVARIEGLLEERKGEGKEKFQAMRALHEELFDLMRAEQLDREAIEAKHGEILDARDAMGDAHFELMLEILGGLSAEQRTSLFDKLDDFRKKGERPGKPWK